MEEHAWSLKSVGHVVFDDSLHSFLDPLGLSVSRLTVVEVILARLIVPGLQLRSTMTE